MTTRIKICGITRLQDAEVAIGAGADALGLNFAPDSPRRVEVETAAEIAGAVAGDALRVGLFVDAQPEVVSRVLERVPLDVLQFHGSECPEACRRFGLPYVKAFRVRERLDMEALEAAYDDACCFLLDAYVPGVAGGTGQRFDWGLWPADRGRRLVLAGGLDPGNVGEAVRRLRPWGVDVSGGVEGARKGHKDAVRIREFISEVKRARS
jgi:phosphoribosylanthranilate isomerase